MGIGVEDPVVPLAPVRIVDLACSRSRGRRRATARTRASPVLQTPVTSAPSDFAIWTANGPTLPDAPSIRTRSPSPTLRPFRSRRPWRARIAECGSVEASSDGIPVGIAWNAASGAQTYSANAPWPNEKRSANTRSPSWKRVTAGPTVSTTPATSIPRRWFRRAAQPEEQAGEGRPWAEPIEVGPID